MTLKLLLLFVLAAPCVAAGQTSSAGRVYYEIFLRSFQDSDGDGVGDLTGATERLDYLQELGVGGVWLMPFHPSPSYHGYDVTDYRAINPDYGTLEDFDTFVQAAHDRDTLVIMDLVVNHTADEHPWFEQSAAGDEPYRDYYLWSEDDPGWRGTGGGPAWHELGGEYYLGLFWSGMPDLNYENAAVTEEMNEIARFWLGRGVDGFRVDAIQHVVEGTDGTIRNTPENLAWVKDFEAFIKTVNPDAFIVGETWTDAGTIAQYFEEADLDFAFDYPLWGALLEAVQSRSASDLAFAIEQNQNLYPQQAQLTTFISNHDQIRPGTDLGLLRRDVPRLKLAAGLLLTLPGTPFLYYGEEIGMPNGQGDKDEEKRTPMRWTPDEPFAGFSEVEPWYPFSTDDPEITVEVQGGDPDSLLSWYRALLELRQTYPFAAAPMELLELDNPSLLAFTRFVPDWGALVIANFDKEVTTFNLESVAAEARDLLSGETLVGEVSVPGTSLRVLEVTSWSNAPSVKSGD